MSSPRIITFYSFKGGVGRTMALANVAYRLASWGRHVLMVDMDLEAPGLGAFLHEHELGPAANDQRDLLTLLQTAIETFLRTGDPAQLPPLQSFIRPVPSENLQPMANHSFKPGRLDFLGMDAHTPDYTNRLSRLDLAALHSKQVLRQAHDAKSGEKESGLVAFSRMLKVYLKAHRFPFRPLGLRESEPPVDTPYDYVLVDSRTGFTEIGGLCVGPLSEMLVVLTGMNGQNVQGTLSVINEIGLKLSDGDPPARLGPKKTVIVVSPAPLGEADRKKARIAEIRKVLGHVHSVLPYHPEVALTERIFVRDLPQEYLSKEYGALAASILREADDGGEQHLDRVKIAGEIEPDASDVRSALRAAAQLPDSGLTIIRALYERIQSPFRTSGHLERAKHPLPEVDYLRPIVEADPEIGPVAICDRGWELVRLALGQTGDERKSLFDEATHCFQQARQKDPGCGIALTYWGELLILTKSFAEAKDKFDQAAELDPTRQVIAENNWRKWIGDRKDFLSKPVSPGSGPQE